MKEEILKLIHSYENRLEMMRIDQMTDDAMPRQKYDGMVEAFERVIEDLKELVK